MLYVTKRLWTFTDSKSYNLDDDPTTTVTDTSMGEGSGTLNLKL